ncbi:MAG: lysophospholipid acyltransferase family protein, partial [Myxococcales bacterium]|nr:lysophospholipid acyltransferase family protein [Myxococcales bacterium]
MIPAAKRRWFTRWFGAQAHARLRATFGTLHLAGREHLQQALRRGPVLVVSNHSSWWDPIVALVLSTRIVPSDAHALMEAANLRRRPFFALVGAFGVDRGSRRDGARAVRHAVSLLDRPGRLVWIFPQGEERPLHERPLVFHPGAARVAERAPAATVLPVALAYAFGAREAPELLVSIGAPLPAEGSAARARDAQAAAVLAELE